MRTRATDRPKHRMPSHRGRRVAIAGLVVCVLSTAAHAPAAATGHPRCRHIPNATTAQYLTGVACPPEGFAEEMGYDPELVRTPWGWRFVKPAWAGAECSGPLTDAGPVWDFTRACAMHDYGYDLVRFHRSGDRSDADRLFWRDMQASCRLRPLLEQPACRALATWGFTGLTLGKDVGLEPTPSEGPPPGSIPS